MYDVLILSTFYPLTETFITKCNLTWHISWQWPEWWWRASTWDVSSGRCGAGGRTSRCVTWSWWWAARERTETASGQASPSASGSGRSSTQQYSYFSYFCTSQNLKSQISKFKLTDWANFSDWTLVAWLEKLRQTGTEGGGWGRTVLGQ